MKLAKSTRHLGRVRACAPRYNSPRELEEKVNEYFELFEKMGGLITNRQGNYVLDEDGEPLYKPLPLTKISLANYLGYSSWQALYNAYANISELYKNVLDFAGSIVLDDMIVNGLNNNYNAAMVTLIAKHQHGWKDNEKPQDDNSELKGLQDMSNEELKLLAQLQRKSRIPSRVQDNEVFQDAVIVNDEKDTTNGNVLG